MCGRVCERACVCGRECACVCVCSLGPASMEQARAEPQGPAQERKLHLLWRAWCPGGCLTGARPWPQEGMLAGVSRLGRPPGPEGTRGAAPAGWPWASSGQLRVPQESMGPLSYLLSSQARKLGQVQRRGHSGGESGGEGAAHTCPSHLPTSFPPPALTRKQGPRNSSHRSSP